LIREYESTNRISYLCTLAGVSRSGYYRWLGAEEARQQRELFDQQDLELLRKHFYTLNRKAGALVLKMHVEHEEHVIMNHKKIRRLMRKGRLVTKIRQADPYRKAAKATQEHRTCPNLLKRQFDTGEPEKVMLTDITYLHYGNGQKAYLSCVKDGATRQILAYQVSTSLKMPIVTRTLDQLLARLGGNIHPEAILHSDQGFHYTHPDFQKMVKIAGIRQSMSRKGNCWDNASMETFFGHLKDELEIKSCSTITELRKQIHTYMAFYNSGRYQWKLKKMTPDEYRSHLLTA
jgi:putative transposase